MGDHPDVRQVARPVVIAESMALDRQLGCHVLLALETFQWTGSFKFRAAYNVARSVAQDRILAASSGNFGQALAYACMLTGKACTIVMPATSAQVKVAAVRSYGGLVDLIDTERISRADRVKELAATMPDAYVASAYDDPLVIEGNATLGEEIASACACDAVVVPVGGGGLASGVITGLRRRCSTADVIGAEPLLANDAACSLREGRIVANPVEPQTIADGARTVSLGKHNWELLRGGLAGIVEVPEDAIAHAVRILFSLANVKAEPTGALSVAAVWTSPERFARKTVCCVISGGNVDPAVYMEIIAHGSVE